MKKNLISLIFTIFIFFYSYGQSPIFYQFRPKYGFIFPHHREIKQLITKHIHSYELRIGIQTYGKKDWQLQWNFPEIGTGIYYAYLGKKLGSAKSIYLFYNMPIFIFRSYRFIMDFALGTAYLNKPFGSSEYQNFAIGSHYNIFADLSFSHKFFFDNIAMGIGVDWTHYSNGGTKMPNLGINVISLVWNAQYYLHHATKNYRYKLFRYKPHTEFNIFYSYGKQQRIITEQQFDVYNITTEIALRYSTKSKVISGIDYIYNKRSEKFGDTSFRALQIAPFLAYSAVIGNVEFIFKEALLIKNSPNLLDQNFHYQVYGLRAEVYKNFLAMLTLKTIWFNAQNIRLGFGYRLNISKQRNF